MIYHGDRRVRVGFRDSQAEKESAKEVLRGNCVRDGFMPTNGFEVKSAAFSRFGGARSLSGFPIHFFDLATRTCAWLTEAEVNFCLVCQAKHVVCAESLFGRHEGKVAAAG